MSLPTVSTRRFALEEDLSESEEVEPVKDGDALAGEEAAGAEGRAGSIGWRARGAEGCSAAAAGRKGESGAPAAGEAAVAEGDAGVAVGRAVSSAAGRTKPLTGDAPPPDAAAFVVPEIVEADEDDVSAGVMPVWVDSF
jgi:hypothetical protein